METIMHNFALDMEKMISSILVKIGFKDAIELIFKVI